MSDTRESKINQRSLVKPTLVTVIIVLVLLTGYVAAYLCLGQVREVDLGGMQPRGIPKLRNIHRIYPYHWARTVFAPAAAIESEIISGSVSVVFVKDAESIESIYGPAKPQRT